ncbi:MAG: Na+/H+ antiporter NhaC family protein [Oscillospiraceae bacterium]
MEKKSGFYGGKIGVWLPVLFMLVGMLVSTIIGGGGLARLTGITFFALALGFLLAKDKKNYGKITLKGLQNPMLGTIIMAYIMAGMLAQLLRQSGLIDALIWEITRLGLNAGWIPMIAFLTCVLISTSCGTSTGSVAAVAPVLLPLAHGLGINMGLMCGAIISGAIFGDNLAPISDTTIFIRPDAGGGHLSGGSYPFSLCRHLRRCCCRALCRCGSDAGRQYPR